MSDKTKELMNALNDLRENVPVLWAICKGQNSAVRIGLATALPPRIVDEELQTLAKEKTIINYYGKTWVLNKNGEDYSRLLEIAKLAHLIEAKWLAMVDQDERERLKGGLSTPARAKVKAQAKDEKPQVRELTEKQQKVWDDIRGWLEDQGRDGEPFTTREAALAQGYDKPGFTKVLMEALVKKGRVQDLGGRPQKWVLLK